jgi:hypothetical protein
MVKFMSIENALIDYNYIQKVNRENSLCFNSFSDNYRNMKIMLNYSNKYTFFFFFLIF